VLKPLANSVLLSTDVLGGLMKREHNLAGARQVNADPPGIVVRNDFFAMAMTGHSLT
jgi:hypothetical protein